MALILGIIIICFFIGVIIIKRIKARYDSIIKELEDEVQRTNADDRSLYLIALRRELGNILISHSPDKYLKNYYYLLEETKKIDELTIEQIKLRISTISTEYPYFRDFDQINTRDYILYSSIVDSEEIKLLYKTYNTIILYSYLMRKADPYWKTYGNVHRITEEELNHLKMYIHQINDLELLAHLKRAKRDNNLIKSYLSTGKYFNPEYKIKILDETIEDKFEMSYGVYIEELQEYGVFSTFYDDDRDKSYFSYYRSDKSFKKRVILDPVDAPYCWSMIEP